MAESIMSSSQGTDPINPDSWYNIPKCVVEAMKYLIQKQKFDSGKIDQCQTMINVMRDNNTKKESKNNRKLEEVQKVLNNTMDHRVRKVDQEILQISTKLEKNKMDQLIGIEGVQAVVESNVSKTIFNY